jgi:hypothetical protein
VDGEAVALELGELGVAEGVVDVVAECAAHDEIFVERGDRFAELMLQRADAVVLAVFLAQFVGRAGERIAR